MKCTPIAAACAGVIALLLSGSSSAAQTGPLSNWAELLEGLRIEGAKADAQLPPGLSAEDQAEFAVMKLGALTSTYLNILQADPDHPAFSPRLGLWENFGAPNSDTLYYTAIIDGSGVYRLRGETGDLPIVNLATRRLYSEGGTAAGAPFVDYDLVQHRKGLKGEIDIVLSPKRPEGYTGDWLYLDPRTDAFGLRLVSDDWGRQLDPRLSLERLDRPSRKSRPGAEQINRALKMLPEQFRRLSTYYANHVAELEKSQGLNLVKEFDYSGVGVLTGQRYFEMAWAFGPDEALIVEAPLPKCRYWSVLLTDRLYATLDWVNNQASLNRTQARIDADGKIRVVIAHSDPGVPNWLDTVDHPRGGLQWRWMGCDSAPTPTVKRVALSQVRANLPPDTPYVSPKERDQILRERRALAQMRRQW